VGPGDNFEGSGGGEGGSYVGDGGASAVPSDCRVIEYGLTGSVTVDDPLASVALRARFAGGGRPSSGFEAPYHLMSSAVKICAFLGSCNKTHSVS
jgi:hypothetical protein